MGDYFDDDDLIGMDEDFDEEPPPEMFGGGGPSAQAAGTGAGVGAGGGAGPMEEFDEDYLAMIEADMANDGGGGAGGGGDTGAGANAAVAPSGQQREQGDVFGFGQDDASASGFDGPPRVIVADLLKSAQETAAAREKRLYGFERYVSISCCGGDGDNAVSMAYRAYVFARARPDIINDHMLCLIFSQSPMLEHPPQKHFPNIYVYILPCSAYVSQLRRKQRMEDGAQIGQRRCHAGHRLEEAEEGQHQLG